MTVRRSLLKSNGSDDANFIDCIWGEDPLYFTVRSDYYFDYRLQPESPARNVGYAAFVPADGARDFYGVERGAMPHLGAYQAEKTE